VLLLFCRIKCCKVAAFGQKPKDEPHEPADSGRKGLFLFSAASPPVQVCKMFPPRTVWLEWALHSYITLTNLDVPTLLFFILVWDSLPDFTVPQSQFSPPSPHPQETSVPWGQGFTFNLEWASLVLLR
jgi:hypothetical protein